MSTERFLKSKTQRTEFQNCEKNYYSYQPALHFELMVGKAVAVKGFVTQPVFDLRHKSAGCAESSLSLNTGGLNTLQCSQQVLEPISQVAGFAGQLHLCRHIRGSLLLPLPNALQVLTELGSQLLCITELVLIEPSLCICFLLQICCWLWVRVRVQPGADVRHLASKLSELQKPIFPRIVLQRIDEEVEAGQELDVLPLCISGLQSSQQAVPNEGVLRGQGPEGSLEDGVGLQDSELVLAQVLGQQLQGPKRIGQLFQGNHFRIQGEVQLIPGPT